MSSASDRDAHPSGRLAGSPAFREAALRGEVRRAYAVIAVIGLITVLVLVRERNVVDFRVQITAIVGIISLMAIQIAVLLIARWAQPRGRSIPLWFIVFTVVIESLIPTALMASHIASGALRPYAALSSPAIFAYGLLISLTTLRLRPALCVLAGTVVSAGYFGLLAYVAYGMGIVEPTTGLPRAAYATSGILIFITGLAAAWVAHELRLHMEAALHESETRRRMDRIEHDLAVASTIQRALLPGAPPQIPGFEIAGWNRPADQTGGDYYDWQEMPDGNWMVTVADVSGHGIGPAMVTAACRAYVRASGLQHSSLASLAARVNELLVQDLPEGRFVTMACTLLSPACEPVALLSAGHGPIVLYVGASGDVHDILPGNLPLAVDRAARFEATQSIPMREGDVLALVTDGFVEWSRVDPSGRREEFGLPRLRESLRRHAQRPAAEIIDAMTAEVEAFAHPSAQQDDLTMVIIRRVADRRSALTPSVAEHH